MESCYRLNDHLADALYTLLQCDAYEGVATGERPGIHSNRYTVPGGGELCERHLNRVDRFSNTRSVQPLALGTFREALNIWYEIVGVSHPGEDTSLSQGLATFFRYCATAKTDRWPSLIGTGHGFIGLAPGGIRSGDIVAIVHGGRYPMILR